MSVGSWHPSLWRATGYLVTTYIMSFQAAGQCGRAFKGGLKLIMGHQRNHHTNSPGVWNCCDRSDRRQARNNKLAQ